MCHSYKLFSIWCRTWWGWVRDALRSCWKAGGMCRGAWPPQPHHQLPCPKLGLGSGWLWGHGLPLADHLRWTPQREKHRLSATGANNRSHRAPARHNPLSPAGRPPEELLLRPPPRPFPSVPFPLVRRGGDRLSRRSWQEGPAREGREGEEAGPAAQQCQ